MYETSIYTNLYILLCLLCSRQGDSDLGLELAGLPSRVVLGRQLQQVSKTVQVRQMRQGRGRRWKHLARWDSEAAAGIPSQTISEPKTDCAASLREKT